MTFSANARLRAIATRFGLALVTSSGLVFSGCQAKPEQSASALLFTHAVARFDCTQEDLAAVVIRLSTAPKREAQPIITIEIAGLGEAGPPPTRLILSGLRRDPTVREPRFARASLGKPTEDQIWLSGVLKIRALTLGKHADGAFDFRTPEGEVIKGTFNARWEPGTAMCG